ncbi:molybdopterin molybdotransferase MoeA [Parvicella tangerina]|uniref:Molybdopterin molybdenumtransferase n=1 Tax=Parvicella tangerina TaxID=2829795 RepID=A0A916N9S3_9FLAO|nr:gephyrin-like molybdotransferase Glp [Parvicella tangerina]CAG5077821.1 Molybdopterin molybdenumtransferase [Parvicella tangerina]
MISTAEAISLISDSTRPLEAVTTALSKSLGCITTEDVTAKIDLPPFDQSAMDGYAICLGGEDTYSVIGEIQAGDDASEFSLSKGEAVKIFTGAMVPKTADLVCRIEDIVEKGNVISVTKTPTKGANIRWQGEQIKKGETSILKGGKVNPATIGFLANLGIKDLSVVRKPIISIISTGNELISPDELNTLPEGKIFESNSVMLSSALHSLGYESRHSRHLQDDYNEVCKGLKKALHESDVLIISGGISVGDYDFVGKGLQENGVKQVFYKVNQKPGKPLFFGTKGNKLVFALPGNPAAALTCFYIYVLPALNKLSGQGFIGLPKSTSTLTTSLTKSNSREQFLKAYDDNNGTVKILEGQSSAMLKSFAEANALIHLPSHSTPQEGETVEVIKLS